MNRPPPPPPHAPPPVPASPSRGDYPAVVVPRPGSIPDASTLEPTTFASVPPSNAPPAIVSMRVPARTATGRALPAAPPLELTGPIGTSFTIPGIPAPLWQWATVHGLQIVIAVILGVLFAMGKASEHMLITVYGILVAAQLNPVRVPDPVPQTYTTTPPGPPPAPSPPGATLAPPGRRPPPPRRDDEGGGPPFAGVTVPA